MQYNQLGLSYLYLPWTQIERLDGYTAEVIVRHAQYVIAHCDLA